MRGRLIFPVQCEIAPLDTEAIELDDDYDDVFRTVKKVDTDNDGIGEVQRKEGTHYLIPAQIEDTAFEEANPATLGNLPEYNMVLVIHFKDLERLGKIDADGRPGIRIGDRLVSIKDKLGINTIRTIPTPPGLYVVEVRDTYDLSTQHRNLLIVFLRERAEGVTG